MLTNLPQRCHMKGIAAPLALSISRLVRPSEAAIAIRASHDSLLKKGRGMGLQPACPNAGA